VFSALARSRAFDEFVCFGSIDEFDCAVVTEMKSFRQDAHGRVHALGKAFDRQQ